MEISSNAIEWIGMAAGTLTMASFVPQLVRTWKMRSAKELSYGWLATFMSGVVAWLVYGLLIHSTPVIYCNGLTLVLVLAILVLKARYG